MVDAQAVLKHVRDVVSVVDEGGSILYVTPSVERVLGYDQDALVGDDVFEYIHPEDRDRVLDTFGRELAADVDEVLRVEFRARRADDSWIWTESVGGHGTEPETSGFVVNTREISERKRKQRRLEEFSGIVSHDLRNPLNVAEGHLELARGECDSDHLEQVGGALDRMESLIDDTLALARQGRSVASPERIDLGSLIEESWRMVETEAATLRCELEGHVWGDPESLKQLFENLFRNAVEHGGEDVTIRVGGRDGGGIYVQDDGPGIPERVRDRIFEPGYTTTRDGTGFGLAIVEEIAEAHGWTVAVDGGGDGARFEITGVAVE
ncbi:MAG: PAS domain-containing sensor histidine kinase [Haloferacaceae archaeon]